MRALFVCNPNNPSGEYRGPAVIEHLLKQQPDRLLVLDEAYAPFVELGQRLIETAGRVACG